MDKLTQFDYLLNSMVHAGQQKNPAEHDYYSKRKALYAYVRDLEAKTARPDPDEVLRLADQMAGAQPQPWHRRDHDPRHRVPHAHGWAE